MKTAFRMAVSTALAAAVLYVLRIVYRFFAAESTLGETVDGVVLLCLKLLALVCVVLYIRCWISLIVDGIRALVRWRAARRAPAAQPTALRLSIGINEAPKLYDARAREGVRRTRTAKSPARTAKNTARTAKATRTARTAGPDKADEGAAPAEKAGEAVTATAAAGDTALPE